MHQTWDAESFPKLEIIKIPEVNLETDWPFSQGLLV